jgi:hypothetical protein
MTKEELSSYIEGIIWFTFGISVIVGVLTG